MELLDHHELDDQVLKIYYSSSFYSTDALRLLPMFTVELNDSGFRDNWQHYVHANYNIIYAVREDVSYNNGCIGFIAYSFDEDNKHVSINGAYVVPFYRSDKYLNIYDIMFKNLVHKFKDKAPIQIISGTHVNNVAAQKAFKRQGRTLQAYSYVYNIDKEGLN